MDIRRRTVGIKGGKEGQGPRDKKKKDEAKANAASTEEADEDVSFAVTYSPDGLLEALGATPATTVAIMDCGATQHFTPNRCDLLNFTEIEPRPIRAANGQVLQATGRGDLKAHNTIPYEKWSKTGQSNFTGSLLLTRFHLHSNLRWHHGQEGIPSRFRG